MDKRIWKTLSFPKALIERIKKVAFRQGYSSLSEYAREAIRKRLEYDERELEEKELVSD
jgi:Predicted transcriptional regulators containing the CopG/Arc/MetJ DNA-binding domain and a metal-binding domain